MPSPQTPHPRIADSLASQLNEAVSKGMHHIDNTTSEDMEVVEFDPSGNFDAHLGKEGVVTERGSALDHDSNAQIILFPHNCSKGEALWRSAKTIPNNELGLPLYYFRYSMFPTPGAGTITQSDIDYAVVPLDYTQGFPCLPSGRPFWSQFDDEDISAYMALMRYLEQPEEVGLRQLHLLALDDDLPGEDMVYEWSKGYLWQQRAMAYDLFKSAASKRRKELRLVGAEERTYDQTTALLKKLSQALDTLDWSTMDPGDAVDIMDKLVKMQRVALGVPAAGPLPIAATQGNTPVSAEIIMRSASMKAGLGGQQAGGHGATGAQLAALASDPAAFAQMQELIIRVGSANNQ